ncbi:hypothetical protein GCM10008944_16360 [Cytobacillus oceanisediminis]
MPARFTRAHLLLAVSALLAATGLVGAVTQVWSAVAVSVVGLVSAVVVLVWETRRVALVLMRRSEDDADLRRQVKALRKDLVALRRSVLRSRSIHEEADRRRAEDHRQLADFRLVEVVRDVEALHQLYAHVRPRAAMPQSGGWALRPADLLVLTEHLRAARPGLVVELGSGTSTVWFAYLLESLGAGRLVTVEHAEEWVGRTRGVLADHGFADSAQVEVRHAPLGPSGLPGHPTHWYDQEVFADLQDIDMLVVDGPPARTGPEVRYPAGPHLLDRVRVGGIVIVDDAGRDEEKSMMQRWLDERSDLERVQLTGPFGSHVALRRTA